MRLYITIVVLLLFSSTSPSLMAQDVNIQDLDLKGIVRDYIRAGRTTNKKLVKGKRIRTGEDMPFEKIGLALSLGSDQFGVQVSTPINDKFKLRVGVGLMPQVISINEKIEIDDDYLRRNLHYPSNKDPIYNVDFKPSFFNGEILASYYPIEEVAFHVTAGLYIGETTFKARGRLVNPDGVVTTEEGNRLVGGAPVELVTGNWPKLKVEKYALDIQDGILDADVKVGWIVKPYIGVGYGYIVPETGWGFNVDLGIIYQGSYKVFQGGREAPKFTKEMLDGDDPEGHISKGNSIDLKKYTNKVQVWPVLNFQVSYRIY